jgi:capsular polysaccharide transport system permease protein
MRTPWQIQQSVIFALFIRELRTRFGSYKGGYIWLLVEPISHIVVLTLMFAYVRQREFFGVDIEVFLVTGIVPFLLFKNVALRVMDGVDANRGLFSFRQIKPMDVFIARALLDALISVAVFSLMLIGLAWLGFDVPFRDPLTVAAVYALLILMGLGVGMILSVVGHYMPEAKTIIRLMMMPLYLLSGIIYPASRMPHELLPYLLWNPLLHAIELIRGAFFVHYHTVAGLSAGYVVMSTLALLALGLAWFWSHRLEMLAR